MRRARFNETMRVAAIALLAHGITTWPLVQDARMPPLEFLASGFTVVLFVSAAWFTLLTLRARAR